MARRKGTPEKLTAAVEKEICHLLELTMPRRLAAEAAGISERTFRYWCELGKQGIERYAAFYIAVRTARARGAANLTTRALKGEKGSAAALVLLARRFPDDYSPRTSANVDDGDWQRQYEHEVEVTAAGRASSAATDKFHEAIALAVADEPTNIRGHERRISGERGDER